MNPCTLGVGCDEYGVCYAEAHGCPDRCGKPDTITFHPNKEKTTLKNYIGYVNDHSGSMSGIHHAAAADYNANISAVKDSATREMLNTVVSVVGIGFPSGAQVTRQLVISNPHVLKPITNWSVSGGTPLYDGIGNIIELHEMLPDYADPNVSFLIIITTDGEECSSRTKWASEAVLREKIKALQATGRWTFVARVPRGATQRMINLGIPYGNVTEWDTTDAGMRAATVQTTQAMSSYMTTRAAGTKSTNVFYTTTQAVNTSKLTDISSKVSLYQVGDHQHNIWVKDFILTKRMEYKVGAAFYQLVKTEARVQPTKLILIRDRKSGAVYAGAEARQMIGLDTVNNARLHPNHGNGQYDIFIQSTSLNRHLPAKSGVLYWEEKGRAMTQADLDFLASKGRGVVQLPQAPATGKPTPKPAAPVTTMPVTGTPKLYPAVSMTFNSRERARNHARACGLSVKDLGVGTVPRWLVA